MSKCFLLIDDALNEQTRASSNALNVIEFVQWLQYINPSQVSPLDVVVRKIPSSSRTHHLYTSKRKPAICVSLASLCESYLYSYPTSGYKHKRVGVRFHSQEWERLVGFTCTVFMEPVLEAQLSAGVVQISTRILPSQGDSSIAAAHPIACI